MIYDCCQDRRGFRVVPKRPASLSKQAFGIVQEQCNVVGRVTSYDWHWNPDAYDPDRSLKLLCRELAGLETWERVYEVLRLLENMTPKNYVPRAKLMQQYRKDVAEYNRKISALKMESDKVFKGRLTLPDKAAMAGMAFDLAKSLPEIHLAEIETFVTHAFPEIRVLDTCAAPTIDGDCAEAVWRDTPPAVWGLENRVHLKACYDAENVYFAMKWKGNVTPDYQFNLLLDPGHTTRQAMVFRVTAAGEGEDEFFDNEKSGWIDKWGSGLAYLGMEGAGNLLFSAVPEE